MFEIAFDSLLALFDLDMTKIPPVNPYGEDDIYAMSMQFSNPNWSAVVVIVVKIIEIVNNKLVIFFILYLPFSFMIYILFNHISVFF